MAAVRRGQEPASSLLYLRESRLDLPIMGVVVTAEIKVCNNFKTILSFSYGGDTYTFTIVDWAGVRFSWFLTRLITYYGPDAGYGTVDEEGAIRATLEEKFLAVERGILDICRTFNLIFESYDTAALSYATWFSEEYRINDESYEDYITKLACTNMVEQKLIGPVTGWHIVKFFSPTTTITNDNADGRDGGDCFQTTIGIQMELNQMELGEEND